MSAHCSAWRLCRQNHPRLKKRMPRALPGRVQALRTEPVYQASAWRREAICAKRAKGELTACGLWAFVYFDFGLDTKDERAGCAHRCQHLLLGRASRPLHATADFDWRWGDAGAKGNHLLTFFRIKPILVVVGRQRRIAAISPPRTRGRAHRLPAMVGTSAVAAKGRPFARPAPLPTLQSSESAPMSFAQSHRFATEILCFAGAIPCSYAEQGTHV
jgi:hypothetical protein